jgi:hypothetical protein
LRVAENFSSSSRCFHRAWYNQDFDVTEIGLSGYIIATSRGTGIVMLPGCHSWSFSFVRLARMPGRFRYGRR